MTTKRRFKVDKLLRDRMPDILGSQDIAIFERVLDQSEYIERLKDKLLEETNEVLEAKGQGDIQEELADVLEVIHALGLACGLSYQQIDTARLQKKQKSGGFEKGIYSAFFEMDVDHADVEYYLANPHKYPELS